MGYLMMPKGIQFTEKENQYSHHAQNAIIQ